MGHVVAGRISSFLYKRTVLVLALLFVAGAAFLLSQQLDTQRDILEANALGDAAACAHTLPTFRDLYTREVVEVVRKQGVTVTHDTASEPGSIPLPATMSMELGERMGTAAGIRSRLYSPYPFPWRQDEG